MARDQKEPLLHCLNLLCGLFLNNIELGGAAWVANLSFLHFTFEALLVNEMSGLALRICAGADNCFKTTAEYILQGGFFGLSGAERVGSIGVQA